MENKIVNGVLVAAVGGVIFKVIKDARYRKLQREMYEAVEVVEDEHSGKE